VRLMFGVNLRKGARWMCLVSWHGRAGTDPKDLSFDSAAEQKVRSDDELT
jgi:hypothetical protein